MMTSESLPQGQTLPYGALIYDGTAIRERGEALSLTDMWRAAKAPEHKKPAKWLAQDATAEFICYLKGTVLPEDCEPFQAVNEGGEWNSWAHWQLGPAYGKYLSPSFHAWCNTVVRAHMAGRAAPAMAGSIVQAIVAQAVALLGQRIGEMVEARLAADPRIAVREYVSVRELLDEAGALPKGRNRINRRIGHALRTLALKDGIQLRRCPRVNTWLFPRTFAQGWMGSQGAALVEDHDGAAIGQGVLRFPGRRKPAASDIASPPAPPQLPPDEAQA